MRGTRALGNRYAAVLVGLLLFVLLLLMRAPVMSNADTVRDLLMARDCLDGSGCHSAGAPAGLGGFQQNASWIWILVGARLLHVGVAGLQVLGFAGAAVAASLVFVIARRFVSPGYALIAALADALAIRQLIPTDVIHNPTLFPLATTLVFWAALRLYDRGRLRDVALVALCVALSVEFHGIGALLIVALLVWIGLSQNAPLKAAMLAAIVVVAVPAAVSRNALEANMVIAQSHALLAIGTAGCAAVLGLSVWLRRYFEAWSDRGRLWAWLGVGGTYPLLVVTLVAAFHEDLLKYYFLPALPPLTIGAVGAVAAVAARVSLRPAAAWVVRGVLALAAIAAFVEVSNATTRGMWFGPCRDRFTLDQIEALPAGLAARGVGYQEAFTRVQADPHGAVIAGFAAFEPTTRSGAPRAGPLLNVFLMRRDAVPVGIATFPVPGRAAAAVVPVASWIERNHATVCTEPTDGSAPRACVTLAIAPAFHAFQAPLELELRAYPRVEELEQALDDGQLHEWADRGTRFTFRYDVHVGAGAGRTLFVEHPGLPCAWHISRIDGVAHTGALPGGSVVLRQGGATRGTLEVTRIAGVAACPGDRPRMPPALYEIALSDKPAQTLLDRCRAAFGL